MRRREKVATPHADAFRSFRRAAAALEDAKADLVAALPLGRIPGVPLAEALASFEAGLGATIHQMAGWRTPMLEEEWRSCLRALQEAARRAEHLRLHGAPEAYEQLLGSVEDLLEPLEAFGAAVERFRELGFRRA